MRKLAMFLFGLSIILASSLAIHAEIYLFEDFESFKVGESLDSSGVWVTQGEAVIGVASDKVSFPAGGKSAYFSGMSGIRHIFEAEDLPEEFFISILYYHDPSENPPPHYMLVFRGIPGDDWLAVGTVDSVPNYSLRDKRGTGQETDTGVKRKDWVRIVWHVTKDGTDVFLDGEEVYHSTITGSQWNQPGTFIWFADVWSGASEAYVDSFVIADTLKETAEVLAVGSKGKLVTTWATLKVYH